LGDTSRRRWTGQSAIINRLIKISQTKMSHSPFKCAVCRRSFSSFAMLRSHMTEHQKQTKHCNNCGANYSRNAYHRC
jgi:transcription elongation factor Elf1